LLTFSLEVFWEIFPILIYLAGNVAPWCELKFDSIIAIAKPENGASIRVMEKAGLRYDRHTACYDLEVIQYCISRADYVPDSSPYILRLEDAAT
jgi:RimJ/RimL family protein N-acetyltransferase